jgi:hypothetical protein
MHSLHAAGASVGDKGTPKACRDISRAYAFFCGRLEFIRSQELHPEGVARIPRTPSGVRILILFSIQGYAQNAYPWITSWHRSAVRSE